MKIVGAERERERESNNLEDRCRENTNFAHLRRNSPNCRGVHCTSAFCGNDPIFVGAALGSPFYGEIAQKNKKNRVMSTKNGRPKGAPTNDGITLIALIITIILLLILAGVTIHFTLGENGLLKNAGIAGEKYEEANAKEQLTLELSNIQAQKYKETGKKATLEDVKNLINKNKYDVTIEEGGSSATIEDFEKEYTFIVDEKLNIQDIEKIANLDKNIKIETTVENAKNYTSATINAKIQSQEEIKSVKIAGNEIELGTPKNEDGKLIYEVEKEVNTNGNYKVKVETINGKTNFKIQEVSEISEDMEIYTADDLVRFRDRVNKGATYVGRIITVMDNLDLRSVCGKENSWEPIGVVDNNTQDIITSFSGTFNGNKKTIDYLYINGDDKVMQGLFAGIQNATISGVIIGENSNINGGNNAGGVVGYSVNSEVLYCGNNGNVTADGCAAGIVAGLDGGKITACYNKGKIKGSACVGGICGNSWRYTEEDEDKKITIEYSYNTGSVESTGNSAGGICGFSEGYTKIANCYNKGKVTAQNTNCGGIVGAISANKYINKEASQVESAAAQITYACNIGNVESSGTRIGGICGHNRRYCIVKNNYILQGIEIKKGTITATKDIGESSNYIGKYVGQAYSNDKTYIDENGKITNTIKNENEIEDITDTVYYIVNGMSNGESEYWSKSNLLEPKLKWE